MTRLRFPCTSDGYVAHQGDPVHQPRLVVVVVDGSVLGCPVVPDGHIARLPVPSNRVLRHGDSPLQQLQQQSGFVAVQADEAAHEIACHQGALTGLRVHPHHRMLGAEVGLLEHLSKRPLLVGQRCSGAM